MFNRVVAVNEYEVDHQVGIIHKQKLNFSLFLTERKWLSSWQALIRIPEGSGDEEDQEVMLETKLESKNGY